LIVATGVVAVVAQLLLIREFLALFRGNEFVIALILCNWLLLGGCGTLLARTAGSRGSSRPFLAALSLLLVALAVLQIPAIRLLREQLFIHGTSVGFYPTFAFILATMLPFCLLVGFLLPYALFVLRQGEAGYPGEKIYMADILGDVGGGGLFTFALVYLVTPLQAQVLAGLPLLFCTALLFTGRERRHWLVLTLLLLPLLGAALLLERPSLARPEGELVHYQESRYGRIEVYRDRELFTLYRDGVPSFSDQNRSRAEEVIHYPLAQLDRVERVLLIGPESGMLEEVARYGPTAVDWLELDPAVTETELRFGLIRKIPGLNLIHQDGRAWLAATDHRYDAIIMNLPEPDTFQVNRFFTAEFFTVVRDHLAPGGVFAFAMEGYDNFLGEPQRHKLSSVYNTAGQYFSNLLLLPGGSVYFLCRDRPLSADIPGRLAALGLSTRYVDNYFAGDLTPQRVAYLRGELETTAPRNTDLNPQLMRLMFEQWFARFQTTPTWFYALLGLALAVYLPRLKAAEFALFSTGFTVMGSETLVIFTFQTYYGYIYSQIGLIVTVFLAGLLPGAWWAGRLTDRPARLMAWADFSLILLLGVFLGLLARDEVVLPVPILLGFGFAVSLLCGAQLATLLRISDAGNSAVTRVFSADLLGAAAGVLLTSVILIPLVGVVATIMALMALKMLSLLLVSRL
jgi:spermidine synthase